MEWAYELDQRLQQGRRARDATLVKSTRTIVVPIVNPDGFNASREAGELYMTGGATGLDGDGDRRRGVPARRRRDLNEYRRKNCRLPDDSAAGNCNAARPAWPSRGVDPNRNYGALLGRPGRRDDQPADADLPRPRPVLRARVAEHPRAASPRRQVTTLITNHTFAGLVLRPPGLAAQGDRRRRADLQGARRRDGRGERLLEPVRLRALRHHRHDRGLELQRHRRPRLHVRDRRTGLPPAVRRDVIKEWNGTPTTPPAAATARRTTSPGEHGRRRRKHSVIAGQGAGGGGAAPDEDVPDADLQRVDVHGHARQHDRRAARAASSSGTSTRPRGRWSPRGRAGAATGTPSPPITFASTKLDDSVRELRHAAAGLLRGPSGQRSRAAPASTTPRRRSGSSSCAASDYDMKVFKADAAGNAVGDALVALRPRGHGRRRSASRRRRSSIRSARTWCA